LNEENKEIENIFKRSIDIMNEWNKRIEENSLTNLHKMYATLDIKKLYGHYEKGCVELYDQANSVIKQYEKSNLALKEIVKTYMESVKTHIERLKATSKLKIDYEHTCEQLESMRNYFYEQFEAPDDEAAASIMASMTVQPF